MKKYCKYVFVSIFVTAYYFYICKVFSSHYVKVLIFHIFLLLRLYLFKLKTIYFYLNN